MLSDVIRPALAELGMELPQAPNRVLAVDDEPDNLEVLEALLEDDYEVLTVRSAPAALALLEQVGDVDVVIADQRMPQMTGVELLSRMAAEHPQTVRMVLTGYSDVEPMLAAINRGDVYRFLLKPFDHDEMRAAVRDAIGLKANATALRVVVDALARQNEALEAAHVKQLAAQQQLSQSEQVGAVGRLVTGVMHDVRNLLTIVALLMDQAKVKVVSPEVIETAERTHASIASLLELLECVRNIARSAGLPHERQPVDANRFVAETLALFRAETTPGAPRISIDARVELTTMLVDVQTTRQAVLALLRNAAGAGAGAFPVELSIGRSGPNEVMISVRDRGGGIDSETLERVRQPLIGQSGGPLLGLGLQLARLAAESHGGRLELESRRGDGTTARLHLAERGGEC